MSLSSGPPLVQLSAVTKRFPGTLALDAVDFTLRAGEIHCLMGENGAGKSTLIKVLTGVYPPDGGQILLEGRPIRPRSVHEAQQLGISTVYQEVNLIPGLSIAENLYLGRQPMRWGRRVDWKSMYGGARRAMERLDLRVDVTRPLNSYSVAIQQMVAIARAVDVQAKVLVLDEPTSSLDAGEAQRLFDVMHRLAGQGMGIIFITHFLNQVYEVSDRITVLRNGKLVGEYPAAELPRIELIARMTGREIAQVEQMESTRAPVASSAEPPILEVNGIGRKGAVQPLSMQVQRGDVVGLAGLLGSGRTETARLLFGIDRADTGSVTVNGRRFRPRSPRQMIRLGLGFCPEDRKTAGIIPDLSLRENIILVLQGKRGWLRPLRMRRQRELARQYIQAMNIATSDAEKPIRFLSGGNQQKAILARWLAAAPTLLILDEPTRGIDVGARQEIAQLIESLRRDGMAVVFISSELEEVVRSCGRVVVLRDRQKIGELASGQISEAAIMAAIAQEVK